MSDKYSRIDIFVNQEACVVDWYPLFVETHSFLHSDHGEKLPKTILNCFGSNSASLSFLLHLPVPMAEPIPLIPTVTILVVVVPIIITTAVQIVATSLMIMQSTPS